MNKKEIENCNLIIAFIMSLEDDFFELFPKLTTVPNINKHQLPHDFIHFLNWSNGFSLFGNEILGIGNQQNDLIKVTNWEQNESNNLMPEYIIPFSPAGNGDFYCFDLKNGLGKDGLCSVIYWQWNYSTKENYEIDSTSFLNWLKELIEDSLMDEGDEDE